MLAGAGVAVAVALVHRQRVQVAQRRWQHQRASWTPPTPTVRVIPRQGGYDLGRLLWHPRGPVQPFDWAQVPSLRRAVGPVVQPVVGAARSNGQHQPEGYQEPQEARHGVG